MALPRPEILAVSFPPSDKELLAYLKKKAAQKQISVSRVVREMLYESKKREDKK